MRLNHNIIKRHKAKPLSGVIERCNIAGAFCQRYWYCFKFKHFLKTTCTSKPQLDTNTKLIVAPYEYRTGLFWAVVAREKYFSVLINYYYFAFNVPVVVRPESMVSYQSVIQCSLLFPRTHLTRPKTIVNRAFYTITILLSSIVNYDPLCTRSRWNTARAESPESAVLIRNIVNVNKIESFCPTSVRNIVPFR